MYRKWKRWMAIILSAGMTISMGPADMIGGQIFQAADLQEAEDDAPVEAIVVSYEKPVMTGETVQIQAFGMNQSEQETQMEVVDTCCFEGNKNQVRAFSNGDVQNDTKDMYISLVRSDTYSTEELIQKLKEEEQVVHVVPNFKAEAADVAGSGIDPYEKFQWPLRNVGQNGENRNSDFPVYDTDFNANGIQEDVDDTEKVIALVDSGMDYTHEDLKDVVWENKTGDKKLPGEHGYDFVNDDDDPMDEAGHGTHCAGVMAATSDDGIGIAGMARSKNIKIMPLEVLGKDENGGITGGLYNILKAYEYIDQAQQDGVNVVAINLSLDITLAKTDETDEEKIQAQMQPFEEIIERVGQAGALTVCAAGNAGKDIDQDLTYPSRFDSEYVISVAAMNEAGELAGFSNYGSKKVDLAAPGTDILSTVSYNCFNPAIYEKKEEMCSTFYDFDCSKLVQTVGAHAGTEEVKEGEVPYGTYENGTGEVNVKQCWNKFFGDVNGDDDCLEWNIKGAKTGEVYYLYLPYEAEVSDTPLYSSVMVKGTIPDSAEKTPVYVYDGVMKDDGSGQLNQTASTGYSSPYLRSGGAYWNHVVGTGTPNGVSEAHQRVIALKLMPKTDGDYTIYVDSVGVSRPDMDEEQFGKYEFMNGTSMAAPHVTAAAAVLANAFPEETALERREKILNKVGPSKDLKDYSVTGGYLNMYGMKQPPEDRKISVDSVEYDKEKEQIVILGDHLKDTDIGISNYNTGGVLFELYEMPIEMTDNRIVISAKGHINTEFRLRIIGDNDTFEETYTFYDQKPYVQEGEIEGSLAGGCLVPGMDAMYYVNEKGNVSKGILTGEEDNETLKWENLGFSFSEDLFEGEDGSNVEIETEVVRNGNKLWTVLNPDNTQMRTAKILVSFEPGKGWEKEAVLPYTWNSLSKFTLAAYRGKLYILGGLDKDRMITSAKATCYDTESRLWQDVPDMPAGKAFGKGFQLYDLLYVTFGCENTEEIGASMSYFQYDGTENEWRDVGSFENGEVVTYPLKEYTFEWYGQSRKADYYTSGIGYEGACCKVMECSNDGKDWEISLSEYGADLYNISTYTLEEQISEDDKTMKASLGDRFYVLKQTPQDIAENKIEVLYQPMLNRKKIQVVDDSEEKGQFTGAREYLPGELIQISPVEGKKFKSLKVDGEEVELKEDGTYSFAPESAYGVTISVVAETESLIQEIQMTQELTLKPGEEYQMPFQIVPQDVENKELEWSSTDESIATVDAYGCIRISDDAKSGAEVTICVSAKNNPDVSARCKITIMEEEITTEETTTEETTTEETTTEEEITSEKVTTEEETSVEESSQWATTTEEVTTVPETTEKKTTQEETTTVEATTIPVTTEKKTTQEETTTVKATTAPETTTERKTTMEGATTVVETTTEEKTTVPGTTTERKTTQEKTTVPDLTSATEETTGVEATVPEPTSTTEETTGVEATVPEPTSTTEEMSGEETTPYLTTTETGSQTTMPYTTTATIESVLLNQSSIALFVGGSQQLSYEILPENVSVKEICWSSADETITTVDKDGIVTAVAPGETEILLSVDGVTAVCKVIIVPKQDETTSYEAVSTDSTETESTTEATVSTPGEEITTEEKITTTESESTTARETTTTEPETTTAEETTTTEPETTMSETESTTQEASSTMLQTETATEENITTTEPESTPIEETTTTEPESTPSGETTTTEPESTLAGENTTTEPESATEAEITTTETTGVAEIPTTMSEPMSTTQKPADEGNATTTTQNETSQKTPVLKSIKVSKVKGLKKSRVTKNSVRLTWKKLKGVSGYKVYCYDRKRRKYKCIKTTKKYTAVILKLKKRTAYRFKVRGYKKIGAKIIFGPYSDSVKVKTK